MKLIYGLVAVLFCGLWAGTMNTAGNRIFSPTRSRDLADFQTLSSKLLASIQPACDKHMTILFDDRDVLTPYENDRIQSCTFERESPVTPFTRAQLTACNVVIVRTLAPRNPRDTSVVLALDPFKNPNIVKADWRIGDKWVSASGLYGYAVYSKSCKG